MVAMPRKKTWWWIAINGASCAACKFELSDGLCVRPTPEQLIGFKTRTEQIKIQEFLLTASIEGIGKYMAALSARIDSGTVAYR